jgi:DNA-binding transcriptional ArsR family regulator
VIAIVGGRGPIPLENLPGRIVLALAKRGGGLSGSQLARELDVTPAAITKATENLVDLGIVRKEPLPVARNVKLYSLGVTVVDDESVKRLRGTLPPILLKLIGERFRDNESLATIFIGQILDYVKTLPDSASVMEKLLKELGEPDHEEADSS